MSKKDNRRKYTKEFKTTVVREYREGRTLSELAKKYSIPHSTLGTWLATYKGVELQEEKRPEPIDLRKYEDVDDKDLLLTEKDETIKVLEMEVERLKKEIEEIKEKAGKEVKALKEALLVMANIDF